MSEPPVAVAIDGLSKRFGANHALRDVSLTIRAGEVRALLGGNGSGKSTLVKVLTGVYRGDAGTIRVGIHAAEASRWSADDARTAGVRVVHQDPAVFADRTVAENLALGRPFACDRSGRIRWREERRRAAAVLARLGIDVDPATPMAVLSPATRTMLAIARAVQDDDGGVLVLDEPTAALPAAEAESVLALVRARRDAGQAVVFVSHRLGEVFAVADTITVLRDGRRVATRPARELDAGDVVELMVGHTVVSGAGAAVEAHGPVRLRVRGLAAGPLAGVDLDVHAGEVVGVTGLLGSGRSSLLRAVFGDLPRTAGVVEVDGAVLGPGSVRSAMRRGVAFVPEDRKRDALFADRSVRHNVSAASVAAFARGGRLRHRDEATVARGWIDRLSIAGPGEAAPIGALSGGNQQKAVLARWLQRSPGLILLDEPTQGVDTAAKATLHAHVRDAARAGAAVVLASSDLDELAEHCDRVLVLAGGRVAAELARGAATPQAIVAASFAGAGR